MQVEPNGVQNNSRQHIRGLVRTPSIHYLSFPIGTAKHLTAQARVGARLVSLCGDPRFPSLTSSITRLVLFPLHCCARPKSETLILGWSTTREHISQSVDQSVNITSVSGILSAVSFFFFVGIYSARISVDGRYGYDDDDEGQEQPSLSASTLDQDRLEVKHLPLHVATLKRIRHSPQ